MIYKTQELYDLLKKLDVQITCLENDILRQKIELSDLKAYYSIVADHIESLVSQAEDQMNEGGY